MLSNNIEYDFGVQQLTEHPETYDQWDWYQRMRLELAAAGGFDAGGVVVCQRIPGRIMRGDCLYHLGCDF